MITWKVFKISKNADMVLNVSYLAIKLPNSKPVDKKLPKLEPRMSHSFDIKIVSRKKLFKVLASPQTHFGWNFSVSKSRSLYEISQYFFANSKLYLWSIHMTNKLILAISFGFKLNSNLKHARKGWKNTTWERGLNKHGHFKQNNSYFLL